MPRIFTIDLPGLSRTARPLNILTIPAGTFLMGAEERSSNPDEQPIHEVRISRPFGLGETIVTQAQWNAVMGSLPQPVPPTGGGFSNFGKGEDYPVDSVSWNQIAGSGGFLEKLRSETGCAVRLPTEAEWEYACRAGTRTRFSFGDSLASDDECSDSAAGLLAGNRSDYMWFCGNPELFNNIGSQPVGQLLPNQFGLYDMHGNMFEFCNDYYQTDFYDTADATYENPINRSAASGRRVIRGGDWKYAARYARSALRFSQPPDVPDWGISFRIAVTLGNDA